MSIGFNLVLPTTKVFKIRVKDDEERREVVNNLCDQWQAYCKTHWLSENHEEPFCAENRVKRFLDGLGYLMMIGDTNGIVTKYMEQANANREIPISNCPSFVEELLYGGGSSNPTEEEIFYLQHLCDKLEEAAQHTYRKDKLRDDTRVVYKITNTANGKAYTGITRDLRKRWTAHIHEAKVGNEHPLYHDIREYGVDTFSVDIIDTAETAKELGEKERFYISYYETLHPYGYNLTTGGETSRSHKEKTPATPPKYDKIQAFKKHFGWKGFVESMVDTDGVFEVDGIFYRISEECLQYAPKEIKGDTLYDMDKVTTVFLPDGSTRFFDMNFDAIDKFVTPCQK